MPYSGSMLVANATEATDKASISLTTRTKREDPVEVAGHVVEEIVSDPLDDSEWMVRWNTLFEVDGGEHGGLGIAPASHGRLSWVLGVVRALYPANLENEASVSLFSGLLVPDPTGSLASVP